MNDNPMHPAQRLQNAPRCTARAKSTGTRCGAPAVTGWSVCRMHGARGGAPHGLRNGRWSGGARTKEMEELRQVLAALVRIARGGALG